MDSSSSAPSSSVLAEPPSLWRLAAERRSRKTGAGNIFTNVNLWQLQRLFRAAGDQDAEQRAELVWGLRDESELAQALIGLRARSHRRKLKNPGRSALGSHWLQAFSHLRIEEIAPNCQERGSDEEDDSLTRAEKTSGPCQCISGATDDMETTEVTDDKQTTNETSKRPRRVHSRPMKRGESNSEKYLHQILR